jgi:hypothetical protein
MLLALLGGSGLTACDHLDDGDNVLQQVIVGDWAFSYELDSDVGLAFEFQELRFRQDGSCSIVYSDGSLEGTYQTGQSLIRIEGSIAGSGQQTMLWSVRSFSERQIVAEYSFSLNGSSVTAVVVLDRIV